MDKKNIIVLYQGSCRFCNWCRIFVKNRDSKNIFDFVSIESDAGNTFIKNNNLRISVNHPESIAVLKSNHAPLYKWAACLEICKHLSGPMNVVRLPLLLIPVWIGDFIYDVIGRNRSLLCKFLSCPSKTTINS